MPGYRCEQALAIDSRNVCALVILALRPMVLVRNLLSDDPQTDRLKAGELISRALAVDSNNYLAHYARAFFLAGMPGRAERALSLSFRPTSRFGPPIGRRDDLIRRLNIPKPRCGSVPTTRSPTSISRRKPTDFSSVLTGKEAAEFLKRSIAVNP